MRKIAFVEPTTQTWIRWKQKCVVETDETIAAIRRGEEPKVSNLYKSQKALFRTRAGPFRGKCAYCEDQIISNQHGDIDHFRPKKGIRDRNWKVVTYKVGSKEMAHPGYYWLAYDWTNLLFSCTLCNQVPEGRKYGKSNRFPVAGKYALRPGEEVQEEPLLINPCVDEPADHLSLDSSGVFAALSTKGVVTVELLGLNDRDLPQQRSEAYQDTVDLFNAALNSANRADRLKQLRDSHETKSFTSARRAAFKTALNALLADLPP